MTLKGLLMTQYYLHIFNFQHYYTTKTVTIENNKNAGKLKVEINEYLYLFTYVFYTGFVL